MFDVVTSPGAVLPEFLETRETATIAALVGVIGAAVSLYGVSLHGLPHFFLAASLPMSALGMALGIRHRNRAARFLGMSGTALAGLGFALT